MLSINKRLFKQWGYHKSRNWYSRLPSITVELVGKEISWYFGETTATGGLLTLGSVEIFFIKMEKA